jgi:hypothetical protein
MVAPHLGEGWQRRVCSNSDYDSWIRVGKYTASSISVTLFVPEEDEKNPQKTTSFIISSKNGLYIFLLLKNESTVDLSSDLYAMRLLTVRKS